MFSLAHQFFNHLFGLFVKLPSILKSLPHYYLLPFWWPILRPAKLVGDLFLVVGSKILRCLQDTFICVAFDVSKTIRCWFQRFVGFTVLPPTQLGEKWSPLLTSLKSYNFPTGTGQDGPLKYLTPIPQGFSDRFLLRGKLGVAGCLWARYAQLEIRSSFDLDACLVISDPFCHGKSLLDHHLGGIYMFHLFPWNYANLKYNMLNCQLMTNSNCFLSHGLFGATSLNLHWRHIQSKSKSMS